MVSPEMERRLLLLRHGESRWNVENRWQGWADIELTDRGRRQAGEAASHLRAAGLTWVVASDLMRALQTASILAAGLGLAEPGVAPEFRERDVGDWSGLTGEEIEAKWPGELARFRSGAIPAPPGGEIEDEVLDRFRRGVERVAADMPSGPGAIVTHGGLIRILERRAGLPPAGMGNLCGRWLTVGSGSAGASGSAGGAGLVLGEAVTLPDPEDRTATTSL